MVPKFPPSEHLENFYEKKLKYTLFHDSVESNGTVVGRFDFSKSICIFIPPSPLYKYQGIHKYTFRNLKVTLILVKMAIFVHFQKIGYFSAIRTPQIAVDHALCR